MGVVRMGPPHGLVLGLKELLGLDSFLETGTYKGRTTEWAGQHFSAVQSIERAESIYRETAARLSSTPNITLLLGDSRQHLPRILEQLNGPALIWLDAHWSGGATSLSAEDGQVDECPLLEELDIINQNDQGHCTLIDDARFFLAPPPAPHRAEQWPSLAEVMARLAQPERYVVVIEDVIVAVPCQARQLVIDYCRECYARDDSAVQQVKSGLRNLRNGVRALKSAARR